MVYIVAGATGVVGSAISKELASENEGYYFLHPFDGYLTIQGTSSLGFEIFNQILFSTYIHFVVQ